MLWWKTLILYHIKKIKSWSKLKLILYHIKKIKFWSKLNWRTMSAKQAVTIVGAAAAAFVGWFQYHYNVHKRKVLDSNHSMFYNSNSFHNFGISSEQAVATVMAWGRSIAKVSSVLRFLGFLASICCCNFALKNDGWYFVMYKKMVQKNFLYWVGIQNAEPFLMLGYVQWSFEVSCYASIGCCRKKRNMWKHAFVESLEWWLIG